VIDCMKIDKWTGVLLRIPRREAVAQCRVQFIWTFTMSNNSILADRIFKFRQSSAVPRAHAHAVEPATQTMRAHLMRAARTSSRLRWCFLRYSGPFLPSCLFGGGVFGPAAG